MMAFWIIAGLLIAAALLFVLPPLMQRATSAQPASHKAMNLAVYRDQLRELEADQLNGVLSSEQYERTRMELESRLLEDVDGVNAQAPATARAGRVTAGVVGLAVPLCAVGLYLIIGTPQALAPQAAVSTQTPAHEVTAEQIETMLTQVAERLAKNPEDTDGWLIAARSYRMLGRFEQASKAYAQLIKRVPPDAQLLADYADALAMAQGQSLSGEPENLIQRALKVDPKNMKALLLAGTIAFEGKDYGNAVKYWSHVAEQVPPESEMGQAVRSSIDEAQTLAGSTGKTAAATPAEKTTGNSNTSISGEVKLNPALAAMAAPDDTVFIFARAAEGPRMPLAILRKQVRNLPLTFMLDDSMAMAPEMKLSNFPRVVVGARISKSGSAMPQAGDLQGLSQPLKNGSKNITVVIDSEVR